MIKTHARRATLAVVAGATVSAAVIAVPAHADSVTLSFTGRVTGYTAIPARAGDSTQHAGDQSFWVTMVYRGSQPVGSAPHSCVAASTTYTLCTSVVDLSGGQITLETALTPTSGTVLDIAVTGGTGAYRGATGQLHLVINADGTQSWTFDIATP